jgi:hypothetical protein
MADARVQQRFEGHQIHKPEIDLSKVRSTSHGQFVYNLHLVFVRRERGVEIRDDVLRSVVAMIERASAGHGHLLSASSPKLIAVSVAKLVRSLHNSLSDRQEFLASLVP